MSLEQEVESKLKESVFLLKLVSGELLIGMVAGKTDVSLTMFFPMETGQKKMISYLPEANDRRLDILTLACVFIKRPTQKVIDSYFQEVMETHEQEFREYIKILASISMEAPTETVYH